MPLAFSQRQDRFGLARSSQLKESKVTLLFSARRGQRSDALMQRRHLQLAITALWQLEVANMHRLGKT